MSGKEDLIEMVMRVFPTQRYQTVVDAEGNETTEPVIDSEGKPVEDAQAVAARELGSRGRSNHLID